MSMHTIVFYRTCTTGSLPMELIGQTATTLETVSDDGALGHDVNHQMKSDDQIVTKTRKEKRKERKIRKKELMKLDKFENLESDVNDENRTAPMEINTKAENENSIEVSHSSLESITTSKLPKTMMKVSTSSSENNSTPSLLKKPTPIPKKRPSIKHMKHGPTALTLYKRWRTIYSQVKSELGDGDHSEWRIVSKIIKNRNEQLKKNKDDDYLHIFTDGSYVRNTNTYGIGVYCLYDELPPHAESYSGGGGNSDETELFAIMRALEMVPLKQKCVIYTDSANAHALLNDKKRRKREKRSLILNICNRIEKTIIDKTKVPGGPVKVYIKNVKGHSGKTDGNNFADLLAKFATSNPNVNMGKLCEYDIKYN